MNALKLIYILNIIVAGSIAYSSIFNPKSATMSIFEGAYPQTEMVRLVGCLWLSIAIISFLGLFKPTTFAPILLLQFIYKGTWLLIVALPAIKNNIAYPKTMALFFLAWVVALPFIIPWKYWFISN